MLRLGKHAQEIIADPTPLGGVAGMKSTSPHGIYRVELPLQNGKTAKLTGLCLDVITETFPIYPLQVIEQDLQSAFRSTGKSVESLPRLAKFVGGDTHLMIGMKYNSLMPQLIFQMPSGLAIYKSQFPNIDGTYGVCGGPHPIIEEIDRKHYGGSNNFINQQYQIFSCGYQVDIDIKMLGFKDELCEAESLECTSNQSETENIPPENISNHCSHCINAVQAQIKKFNEIENAGSEIQYRCITCRNCKDCKNHDSNEATSIKEDVEDQLIKNSINIDTKHQEVTAKLPLLADPAVKLAPNADIAKKVYNSMVKRLNKNPADVASVIKAELKLHNHGFVDYVANLPE